MKAGRASVAARGVAHQHEHQEESARAYGNQAGHKKWSAAERVERVDEIVDHVSLGPWHGPWIKRSILLMNTKVFRYAITSAIFVAALSVALQTYSITSHGILVFLVVVDVAVLLVFIFEIAIKFLAEGKHPWQYFQDSWNVFDFCVVLFSFLPIPGDAGFAVTAFRLLRLLRVLKLVKALPKLRILVIGLISSFTSVGYVSLLLLLTFYFFACSGVVFFGKNDPVFMGNLFTAMLTLFRCATLEDWTDVMYINMYGCEKYGYEGMEHLCTYSEASPMMSVAYFCSFIVIASMMVMNLFIGIIASSVEEAKTRLGEEEMIASMHLHPKSEDQRFHEMLSIIDTMAAELEHFAEEEFHSQRDNMKQTLASYFLPSNRTQDLSSSAGTGEKAVSTPALQPEQAAAKRPLKPDETKYANRFPGTNIDTAATITNEDIDTVCSPHRPTTGGDEKRGNAYVFRLEKELEEARQVISELNSQLKSIDSNSRTKKRQREALGEAVTSDDMIDVENSVRDGFVSPKASPLSKYAVSVTEREENEPKPTDEELLATTKDLKRQSPFVDEEEEILFLD
jgi:voltage-gated sodium channel